MCREWKAATLVVVVGIIMPLRGQAQTIGGWADELQSLHSVLEQLYNEMLPMCSELIGVGRGLAGFAAL